MRYAIIGLMALALTGCQFLPKTTVQLVNEVKNGTVLIENKIDVSNGGTCSVITSWSHLLLSGGNRF